VENEIHRPFGGLSQMLRAAQHDNHVDVYRPGFSCHPVGVKFLPTSVCEKVREFDTILII